MSSEKKSAKVTKSELVEELRENLRLSKATLSKVLQLSENIVVVVDRDGGIIEISDKVVNLLGILREDIIGKISWKHFIYEEDLYRIKGYFEDRLRGIGNPPDTYTLRVKVPGEEPLFMRAFSGFVPGTENRVVILKDLSEAVQQKKKAAESEERYRTVVENTEDGILICDEDRILFANKSFCAMTGHSREDVYAISPVKLFHESYTAKLETLFRNAREGNQGALVFETKIKKDKGFLPAELSSTPMIYRNAKAILFSIRDLTQRYETERKLNESHRLMKAIVDNSPVGISVHDRNGTLLMANASWRAIWNKSLEEQKKQMVPRAVLRMDSKDSYLGEYLDDVEAVYREGGEVFIPKLRLKNPASDGAEFISHHFYALMDENNKVEKVVILTQDLTESLKTKFELNDFRDQYADLFENIPVAVYRTTQKSQGRIVAANPEMYKMFFGEEKGDFSNIKVEDLYVHSSRREDLKKLLSEKAEIRGFEAELRRLDGSTFLASISAREVSGRTGVKEYIEGIVRDITDQRRMEEELQRVEHLESIGTLAGGIAHDFNNLLMAIQGNLSLALLEKDSSRLNIHLKEAESSLAKASSLARQLLTFARGGVPVKESVDITSLIKETVLFTLRGSDVKANFKFEKNIDKIEIDTEQIARVIHNMILNAVQATTGNGKVTVSCGNVKIKADSISSLNKGDYVKISIKDNGKGIPADELKKIFNPYFTTKPEGTGLGLSTSYSIVSRHSGAMEVFSEEGRGTELIIYLPASKSENKSNIREKAAEENTPGVSAHVLIMDDDPKIRKVLSDMLKVLGHEVTESSDGAGAVELYRSHFASGDPFDVVIMDLTIPGGMGGEAAIKKLKEIDPHVKSIISSGYSTNPVLSNYSNYGFDGELVKPYRIATLKEELKAVLLGDGKHGK